MIIDNVVRSYTNNPRKLYLIIAGSEPSKIQAGAEQAKKQKIFKYITGGTTPFYLDAYLPFVYEVFETI